jgi:hypothetical protein
LENLEHQTLLFLNNIEEMKWKTPASQGHYLKSVIDIDSSLPTRHVEIIAQSNGVESFQEFLVFSKPFELDDKKMKAEIAYQLNSDGRISPFNDSRLVVFFPTEKTTLLKFLIHGPYKTTPNRENIPLEDSQNQRITEEIATLVADSLPEIRTLGLLDVEFLQILPINSELNNTLHPIYSAVFESVKFRLLSDEELLPTNTKGYTSAHNALLARESDLTDLFTQTDIEMLFNRSNWLETRITTGRTPRLKLYLTNHLNIKEKRIEDFASAITEEFLNTKDDDWMARFYTRLNDTPALWRKSFRHREGVLRRKPIIRLTDGSHCRPYDSEDVVQIYLPTETESLFPTV